MKKLSVNDLHKSIKNNLGENFQINELDFATEFTQNKEYRDLVLNQIIPAIDSEFTPDLASEIEQDLKKKDSSLGSLESAGVSGTTISPDPVDPPKKKKLAKYFRWEDQPYFGARTPQQFVKRRNRLNSLEQELSLFEGGFVSSDIPTEFSAIDLWENVYGEKALGEFWDDTQTRDDMVARGVMNQKAIQKGFSFVDLWIRTYYPEGFPDEIVKGQLISRAVNERATQIGLHEDITEYLENPTEDKLQELLKMTKTNNVEELSDWYQKNAEALLELDDISQINVAQPLPEAQVGPNFDENQEVERVPDVGFSGNISDALEYLKQLESTDAYKDYAKIQKTRDYFVSQLDAQAEYYPEYTAKIATEMKMQEVTDDLQRNIDKNGDLVFKGVHGIGKSLVRGGLTIVHGVFDLSKTLVGLVNKQGVTDELESFVDFFDPDNNRFTNQSSKAKRIGFEYTLDLGDGFTAVYDSHIEDGGAIQYVIDADGFMVNDPYKAGGLIDKADALIESGKKLEYDFDAYSMSAQTFQAVVDVAAMMAGGEAAAASKVVAGGTKQGLKFQNFLRSSLSGSKMPITAARTAQSARAFGSTGTMFLQMHHGIYDQAIMNGMTSREASYYALGSSAAIALVNRINPEYNIAHKVGKTIKNYQVLALERGLTNRDLFKMGFSAFFRTAPKAGLMEAVEERYLERMGQSLVGAGMQAGTAKNLQIPEIEVFSFKEMQEFFIGGIVGFGNPTLSVARTYSDITLVQAELVKRAYDNKERTFRMLDEAVGRPVLNSDGDIETLTEEQVGRTKSVLERSFAELDQRLMEARGKDAVEFTEHQKQSILSQIIMKNSIEGDDDIANDMRELNESTITAMLEDPRNIDDSFSTPFSDAYKKAKTTQKQKELDAEVSTLLGNRNTDTDPKHVKALSKMLESNFKNVPVYVDQDAFRAFMKSIGVSDENISNYRGVYDEVNNAIMINPLTATLGTPIHEYSHVWVNYVKRNNPELYAKMEQLVLQSPELMAAVKGDAVYRGKEAMEAMVIAIEKRGEEIISDPSLLAKIKDAINELFKYLAEVFNVKTDDFKNMTLQEFVDQGAYEVLTGDFILGGTIDTLPAQNTTLNKNIGNSVSVLTSQGRVEGSLLKNKAGEFFVRSSMGDVVVARPDQGTNAIGDLGLIRTDLNERVKIVPAATERGTFERLVEIDGRLHLISDDSIAKDNMGRSYGLILQDKESGKEMFFSIDNEITQEIMRKAIAGRQFSKVPDSSEIFQIGIAPFRSRAIENKEAFDDAIETPQYKFFENTLDDITSELKIKTISSFAALGGYEFEDGEYVNEVSRVMQLLGSREDIELLSAVMGILAPEQQESVMMLEIGDGIQSVDVDFDPELGFHVAPESVWSESFDSRRLFMLEMLRQDFESATGITGNTIEEEAEAFEEKYGYRPYFLDVTEDGQFVMAFPYSMSSMIDLLREKNVTYGSYPFVVRSEVDRAFEKGFDNISNEGIELLSTINTVFSRIYNLGLPARFEFDFGPEFTAANNIREESDIISELEGQSDEVIDDALFQNRKAREQREDIIDDAALIQLEIRSALEYIAKKTIGTDHEVHQVFSARVLNSMTETEALFNANSSVNFGRDLTRRNFDKPLGLIIQMESTELQGVDKIKYITDFAKSVGIKGYSFDPNTDRLHIFVNNNDDAYKIIFAMEGRWDVNEVSYARVKPRFKSENSTRLTDSVRSRVERGYYETIKAYRSKRPDLRNERPNLYNALSIAEEAYVRDEAHRSDNRSMINTPVKIEWNDAKSDYMIGGMTMQQYGFRYGLTNFGGVRPRKTINIGGGVTWDIPGGLDLSGTFTYAELIWMKEQGWNPNDIKDEFVRTAMYRKLARTHTQEGIDREVDKDNEDLAPEDQVVTIDPVDNFNRYIFGMLSPNQPLTPNEMQVAAMRVQGMEDPDSDEAIRKWFGGQIIGPFNTHGLPGDLYAEGYTYSMSSVTIPTMSTMTGVQVNFQIDHYISDGSIHTHQFQGGFPWYQLQNLMVDSEGNPPANFERLKAYIQDDVDITTVFPANYDYHLLEREAEYRWPEIALGIKLYVTTSRHTRTQEQDDIYDAFIAYADLHPWLSNMVDGIYQSYTEETKDLIDNFIDNIKGDFIRGYVVSEYLSELRFESMEDEGANTLERRVQDAAVREQSRLNQKRVDPIFREDSGSVRTNLYMGVANISKTPGDGSYDSLADGTKLTPETRVFFHGTRFFFDKLDRVEEAKGSGTETWNETMKPSKGFTPFISPSYSMANGFKGIGGEVLAISVAADTKVFDPARMGNLFGDLARDENLASNSSTAFAQQMHRDFESLARGEQTTLPYNLVGAGLIANYMSANSIETFYERYFPKSIQNFQEGDPSFVELSYEYGVNRNNITAEFFRDLSADRDFLRRLAVDLLAEDLSVDDVDRMVSSDFLDGATNNFIDSTQGAEVVPVNGMPISVYALPNYVFAELLHDIVLDGLDTDFANLVDRYKTRSIKWSDMAPNNNYASWTRNQYGYADDVNPIVETIALIMKFADNDFRLTEQPAIVDFFEEKGYDAFVVREFAVSDANLAVINPDKINLKYRRGAPGIPRVRNSFTAQDVEKVTIQGLANMYPKDASEALTAEERKELNNKMKKFFNMQKMDEGGLGLAGSADLSNVARFAKMYLQNPNFFMKKKMETWVDFLERVQNQVPGLSSKTGSFSIVWQDPGEAAVSAMDRHMLRIFEKELFKNKEVKSEFERIVVQRWNAQVEKADAIRGAKNKAAHYKSKSTLVRPGAKKAKNLDEVMAQYEFGQVGAIYMETGFSMISNNAVKYKYKSGEVNPSISVNLKGTKFIVEPDKVESVSENYMRMLAINEERARQAGLSVFMSQWALWDKARNRFEPHEVMFPGLHKLPRMSFTNLMKARSGHRDVGYFNSSKIEKFNDELNELTKELKPVQKAEPGSLLYFSADPYRGIDMKQAKEIVGKYRKDGMTSDTIREAFIRGGMDPMLADALISVEFNPSDPTIPEKLRLGFQNFAGRLSSQTREEITDNAKNYLPRSNKITTADAYLMLEKMGLEAAYDLLMNPSAMQDERLRIGSTATGSGVPFAESEVRVVLTRIVAEEFDKIADQMITANEPELEREYRLYSSQLMDNILPELTQKGRFIQAASILARASGSYYVQHINNRLRAKGEEPLGDEDAAMIRRLHAAMKNAEDGLPKIEAEAALLRYVSEALPVSLYEILENQYYANLLSGYGTNLKNIYGSFQQLIFEGTTEAVAGGSIRDAGAYYWGMLKGMLPAFDIFRFIMATGIQYGYNTTIPGLSSGKFDDTKLTEGLPIYEYMKGGLAQITQKDGRGIFKGSNMVSNAIGRVMLTIFNPSIMKYFGRTLIGTDVAFSTLGQSAQIELMKSRLKRERKFATDEDLTKKARELVFGTDPEREARYKGYSDKAEAEGYKKGTPRHRIRVFELARGAEVTEKMGERAFRKGQEYTYNYEPEGFMGQLYSLFIGTIKQTKDKPMGPVMQGTKALFIPFARILVNVANRGYSYSPLGFLKQSAGITTKLFGEEARKLGRGGTWTEVNDYEKALARSRATIGTMITMFLYGMTMGDDGDDEKLPWMSITGAGPSDYSKRYQLSTNNVYKPFTITINRSFDPKNFGELLPVNERKRIDYRDSMVFMTLAAVGTIRDHERFGDNSEVQANRALSTAVTYATSMLASMNESTLVKGLSDLFKEIQPSGFQSAQAEVDTKLKKSLDKGYQFLENVGSGLLTPNIVRQLTRTGRGLSNRAIQQKVGSSENPEGYFKDLIRDMHMIDTDFPIMDHFGRPVVPTYDNYLPVIVQPAKNEKEVHKFFREYFLDNNLFVPKHSFPEMVNELGEAVEMTKEEEMTYFALRGALIYDGIEELMYEFDEGLVDEVMTADMDIFEEKYPDASEQTRKKVEQKEIKKNLRKQLSDIVSNANEYAEGYIRHVKFDDVWPENSEGEVLVLPDYILNDAPYRDELFKKR